MSADTYTRWAVIASGEGGSTIASCLFRRRDNPGIEDRVLMMNTNRTDFKTIFERLEQESQADINEIQTNHTLEFGSLDGVGNYFPSGEYCAKNDENRITDFIEGSGIDQADAFLYMTTLGGGTGNGSVPYLIRSLKKDPPTDSMADVVHVVLAAWPYRTEGGQRHFNAVCGLSRLLRWYDGTQNADMVLLVSNSHVADDEELQDPDRTDNETVNRRAIQAIDMMIGAGRETHGVVDVSDLVTWPSRLDSYHFTAGIALDQPTIYELSLMFDNAVDNLFVPMDPTTADVVYPIVRAPAHLVEADEYTHKGVQEELDKWLEANGMDEVVHEMPTLTPVDKNDDTIDVLLLFGGFDLDQLLEISWADYERMMDMNGRADGSTADSESDFSPDQWRSIQQNLNEYLGTNMT